MLGDQYEKIDYNKQNEYKPFLEYEYDTLKEEYINLISNSINLVKVIQVEDIEKLDISKLINQIM